MVDRSRICRRWAARRIPVLGATFLAVLGTGVWFVVHPEAALWLKLAALPLAGAALLLLGYFLAQTAACAVLLARGRSGEARSIRARLGLSRGAVAFSLGLMMILVLAPGAFREADRREPPRARESLCVFPRTRISPAPIPEPERRAEVEPAAPPERPALPPVAQAPPPREEIPLPPAADGSPAEAAAAPVPAEEGEFGLMPRFPWWDPDPFRTPGDPEPPKVARLGLGETEGEMWPPPEFRLDLIRLDLDGHDWGLGMAFWADIPIGACDLVRATWMAGVYFDEGNLEGSLEHGPSLVWHHATLEYVRRLFGYAREAPFDLAVAAGLSVDAFEAAPIDPSLRPGPHAAVEAGVWQGGPAGFVLRAAQSIPANLTGSVSSLTNLSAVVRLDLSEGVSLHLGYQVLRIRLRDYHRALDRGPGRWEMEETSRGPLLGCDVRF